MYLYDDNNMSLAMEGISYKYIHTTSSVAATHNLLMLHIASCELVFYINQSIMGQKYIDFHLTLLLNKIFNFLIEVC